MATLLRRVLQLNCTKTVLPLLLRWTNQYRRVQGIPAITETSHTSRETAALRDSQFGLCRLGLTTHSHPISGLLLSPNQQTIFILISTSEWCHDRL
jgi:hypothetical protein